MASPLFVPQTAPSISPNASSRPDATIIVMGSPGTGKSTFIRSVTGDERIKIGHTLESQPIQVNTASFFEADGRAVTLVDTPGFDDSRDDATDADVLREISGFLKTEYEEGRRLSGLIYMHRIGDVRVSSTSRRNLNLFQKLCGSQAFMNVVVVTTMWDIVTEELGSRRELDLLMGTFKPLLDAGARMRRFYNNLTSATEIISYILSHDTIVLQIQQELVAGKELSQTAAGETLDTDTKLLIAKHQRDVQALHKEFDLSMARRDKQAQQELREEREKMQAEIRKLQAALDALGQGLEYQHRETSGDAMIRQDRRSATPDEGLRAKFLEQIASERRRWFAATNETTQGSHMDDRKLRAQLDVRIKEVHAKTHRQQAQLARSRGEQKTLDVRLREHMQRYHDLLQLRSTQVTMRADAQEGDCNITHEKSEKHLRKQQRAIRRIEAEKKQAVANEQQAQVMLRMLQVQVHELKAQFCELKAQRRMVTKMTSSDADNLYLAVQLQRCPQGAERSSGLASSTADLKSEQHQASAEDVGNLRSSPSSDLTKGLSLGCSHSPTLANFKVQLSAYHISIINSEKRFNVYERIVQQLIEVCDTYARRWLSDSAHAVDNHTSSSNREGILCWYQQLSLCIEEFATLDPVSALIRSEKLKEKLRQLWIHCPVTDMRKSHKSRRHSLSLLSSYTETFERLREVLSLSASRVQIMSMDDNDAESFIEILDKALDALDASDHLRRQCLDLLRKLCGQHRIVPKSFNLLPGTVRRVGTYPEASGAFAEVWKGQYDGQPVALKVFRILKGDDKGGIVQDLKTFCQEAIIWKRLRHRNITPFHGVDSTSFLPRLAMVCDWMFHGTITVYLENNQSADRLRLILDVAEGLQYLHHSDIVHGDLKSHNILVNEQRTACITDFGLAAMHFAGKLKTISVTAGSTRWMSPELIDPEQFDLKKAELSRQSDIYALALVMWEIFTGRIPFYQFTREATVITQVLRGTRPRRPPQATQLGLLDDVWTMIEACWQPVWQDRPDTDALVEGVRKTLAEYAASGAEHTPQTWPLDMD